MCYPYQNPNLSPAERTKDLLSRMTLEEKFTQMRLLRIEPDYFKNQPMDISILEQNAHRLGAIYNATSAPPETIRIIQDWIISNTRLGIPASVHGECLHGFMHKTGTVFPQVVGLSASFNRNLIADVVTQIAKEFRSSGFHLAYAPNVDLSRDPRWGRVEENFGEDPYLTSELGVTYVKALQSNGVASCPKHFVAHGSPEGGVNLAPVHAGEREFRETMLVPFQKVITEGKAMGIMPAYSEWDGEAVHASKRLLTDLLRDELGFDGYVISDYVAIHFLQLLHRVASNRKEAGVLALNAGVDMEAPHVYGYGAELEEAVRTGEVPEALVDLAVSRVLKHKFEMGLFENPYPNELVARENHNEQAIQLARKAAEESVVLLKNENNLLPLSNDIKKIAIVGPNAADPKLGDYTVHEAVEHAVTIKQALTDRLGEDRVSYALGCCIADGTDEQIAEAVQAAQDADAVVVVLGDNSNWYANVAWGNVEPNGTIAVTCGESFDNHSLELPGRQQELLETMYATGKPVILIMESGRPYAIRWAKEHIPAIIQAWYPGEQGGPALVDILFGDVNPSGRLPISFPRSSGHIPAFYNYKPSARGFYNNPGTPTVTGRDYVFDTPNALFTFGEGLSYTTFSYSNLTATTGKEWTDAEVSVCVENTGSRAGYEVVQLYVSDVFCRITPFVRRLRGFQKVWLAPGEKKTIQFSLGFEDFSFINEQMKHEVEPGEFILRVGSEQYSLILTKPE